jgi:hypothetical protein
MLRHMRRRLHASLPGKLQEPLSYYYKLVCFSYRNIKAELSFLFLKNKKLDDLALFEQRFNSQNGEDGILRAILYKIMPTNKHCVEFGIHPSEGNTIHLAKRGWPCLWMDGGGDGKSIKKEYITAENINALFKTYAVPDTFDVLSIDVDSNDYWIWKAIEGYSPRVVIMEYNASIPPTESKTVTYDPHLRWDGTTYFGASLLALQKLGTAKGYTLISCDKSGSNAFFVRNDLVQDNFKVHPIEEIYRPPAYGMIVNGKHIGHTPSTRSMISV